MSIVHFSEEYYKAKETVQECVYKLNSILDEDGQKILSTLLEAERIICNEQVVQRFKEGWHHGRSFSL